MIYSYSKHNFFGGTFLLGETVMLSASINGRFNNKKTFLSKVCPIVQS